MTLRLRLTLWYSAVLAGVIFAFGSAVYGIMSFALLQQVDNTLAFTAEDIIRDSRVRSGFDVPRIDIPELDRLGASRVFVQVWQADGTLADLSDNFNYFAPLDAAGLTTDRPVQRDVYIDEFHLRVLTVPVTVNGRVAFYIQAATSLELVDWAKNALLLVLVSGGVGAVALAALVGWLTAHRALQPLEMITQTALQITRADDLSRRIPLSGNPMDEVSRLTQAFNESLERLERLFNAQRRFLADVSHELRTPLTVIRGNVDLMRRMRETDATSLDAIQSEAERMIRLVGDLLLLAQAEAGTLPIARHPVELDTLLLEVLRESQVLAGKTSVGIEEIDQAMVVGDRDRLKQLLLNLLSNAIKYTPEGGRVTLGLCRVNDWARVVVADNGMGIPPAELPHIFDRFYRVDKARSRAQGGSGLGLSIAQRIAQMHGGRIEVSSDGVNGHGSTFSLWLPLAPEKQPPEPAKPAGGADANQKGGELMLPAFSSLSVTQTIEKL